MKKSRTLLFAFLILLPALCLGESPRYERMYSLTGRGRSFGYAWAHGKNLLAFSSVEDSMRDKPGGGRDLIIKGSIYVLDADTGRIVNIVTIMGHKALDLAESFGWLPDDSGFAACMERGEKSFPCGNESIVKMAFSGTGWKNAYEYAEGCFACKRGISLDETGNLLALLSTGEGHPDVAVYRDREFRFCTDVYPSGIGLLGWRNGKLYCRTGAFLEYGLTREEREKNPAYRKEYFGREECRIYAIDPDSGKAELAPGNEQEIFSRSHDGRFRVEIKEAGDEQSFSLSLYKRVAGK